MKLRHALVLALLPLTALGACKKRPQVVPVPDADTMGVVEGNDAANEDSIRLANEAADRERLERERAERDRLERERLERETAGAREVLTDIIFFEYDSDEIQGEAEEKLRLKAAVLAANPNVRLRIEGHADQRGSTEYNLALGQRRAEAVRAFLANYGIDPDRFTTVSYGKERPLVEGEDEEAWSRNRRAEFAVIGGQVTVVPEELR
ncbi:MAG TPA: peptidoglycan-associated lipoprotein Pal [Longimicrobium sp.]|nr:peptidoglycan-associated lipoprotein Pal [Longimicrobium sp.]